MRRLIVLCLLLLLADQASAVQQQFFQDEPKAGEAEKAKKQLQTFLDSEAAFPKLYAAKSTLDVSVRGTRSSYEVLATQWIAIDEANDRWIAEVRSKISEGEKAEVYTYRAYWNKKSFWVKQENFDFSRWDDARLDQLPTGCYIFQPRFAWTADVQILFSTFDSTPQALLAGRDCVGVKDWGRLNGSLWANKKSQGLNRVTGVFFDATNTLVHARLSPSLKGDFDYDVLRALENNSGFEFHVDLKWKSINNQVKVLERVDSRESKASGETVNTVIKTQWLFDDEVGGEYLADPRLNETPSLKRLDFRDR